MPRLQWDGHEPCQESASASRARVELTLHWMKKVREPLLPLRTQTRKPDSVRSNLSSETYLLWDLGQVETLCASVATHIKWAGHDNKCTYSY